MSWWKMLGSVFESQLHHFLVVWPLGLSFQASSLEWLYYSLCLMVLERKDKVTEPDT